MSLSPELLCFQCGCQSVLSGPFEWTDDTQFAFKKDELTHMCPTHAEYFRLQQMELQALMIQKELMLKQFRDQVGQLTKKYRQWVGKNEPIWIPDWSTTTQRMQERVKEFEAGLTQTRPESN